MSKPIECTVTEKIILALVGRLYSGLLQESGLPQEGREIRLNSKYRKDSWGVGVNKQRETEAYSLIKGLEEGKLSKDVVKKPILRDSIGPVCLAA